MLRLPDQMGPEALGAGRPDSELLHAVVAAATGDPAARAVSATVDRVDYPFSSISTGGLFRVTGAAETASGATSWSAFVKLLQHPRHWPMIDQLPPRAAEEIRAIFPWKDELDVREQVLPVLPPGLRVPDVYCLADLGDDRLAVWMEEIDVDDDPWELEAYARAAHLLARLAARRTPGRPAGACRLAPGLAVRKVVESRAPVLAGLLDDDALWARPLVAGVVDDHYRTDVRRVLEGLPRLLSGMDRLPSALPHGDAAPVNLLRPRGQPGSFVAIDWAFGCQLPLGFDLGQLVVGEVERGRMDPDRLPELLEVTLAAYVDGLAEEGVEVRPETVRRGWLSSLGPRTVPGAFPLELTDRPATDEHVAFLRRRAGLGRFVLDQVLA